jgi:amidase
VTEPVDATALLERLRAREVSPDEVAADAIERIEHRNPPLNAVIRTSFERTCAAPDGPLAGVPTLLKDLGGALAGEPLYQGNRLLRRIDQRAVDDSPIARRLVDAGAVVLGRTNTPEFGAGVTTQPLSYGPTRNPWDPGRSTSGSSGGAGAAVATGMVPFAHGNDYGGSIRLPAAWCGVIGLKPTRARIANVSGPNPPDPGVMVEFLLTRSLRDTALLLDVLADGSDPSTTTWRSALEADPGRLRLGLVTGVDGVATDGRCADAAADAARRLAARGHEVVDLGEGFLADERWDREWRIIRAKGAQQRLVRLAEAAGRPLGEEDAEPFLTALAAEAPTYSDETYAAAGQWQLDFAAGLQRRWRDAGIDALLTPAAGLPPCTLEEMAPPAGDPASILDQYRRVGCFSGAWNMVGFPAISVPWWRPDRGDALPIGVQVVAGHGREDLALQVARQLQDVAPDETRVRTAEVSGA